MKNRMSRRDFVLASSTGLWSLAWAGCDDSTSPRRRGEGQLFTDPEDPTIASFPSPEGDTITIMGVKDPSTGRPLRITDAVFLGPGEAPRDALFARYDTQGRPISLASTEVGRLRFTYADRGRLIVTYTTPDGLQEAQFPVGGTGTAGAALSRAARSRTRPPRVPPDTYTLGAAPARQGGAELRVGRVLVSCTASGESPISGAEVMLWRVLPQPAPTLPPNPVSYTVEETAPGVFTYLVSSGTTRPLIGRETLIGHIGEVLDAACKGGNVVQAGQDTIAREIARILKIAVDKVRTALKRVTRICNVNEVLDKLEEVEVTSFPGHFTAYARHPVLGSLGDKIFTVPPFGPVPDQVIPFTEAVGFQTATRMTTIDVAPLDPSPDQDYRFTVQTICAAVDWSVSLSIVGTDGYEDSQTFAVTRPNMTATLLVPGAEAGVVDEVTAVLRTRAGQVVGRELKKTVVF